MFNNIKFSSGTENFFLSFESDVEHERKIWRLKNDLASSRELIWHETGFLSLKLLVFFFPFLLISSHCMYLSFWMTNEWTIFYHLEGKKFCFLGAFEYNMKNMKRWIFLDVASFTKLLCQLEEIFTTLISLTFSQL